MHGGRLRRHLVLHDAHLTNCVVNLAYLQYLAKRPLEIQKCSLYFIVHDENAQNMNAQNRSISNYVHCCCVWRLVGGTF